jgi:uncharacterized protein with HEPN domain
MPKRDLSLYLHDVLDSAEAIREFVAGMGFEAFAADRKTYSATIREYIIIGEAITALKSDLEVLFPDYEWRMIKDFRNFLVHEYFGIDAKVVWDVTQFELLQLVTMVQTLKDSRK